MNFDARPASRELLHTDRRWKWPKLVRPDDTIGHISSILDDVVSTKNWWLLLVAGVAWIVIAVVILRFDYATVATIATLFGFFSFLAAANEVMVGAVSTTGWRILHWILAGLFVVVGVIAFIRPGDTFVGLAAVMSFYFVFRGSFDIAMAFAASEHPVVGACSSVSRNWRSGSGPPARGTCRSPCWCAWVAAGALIHGVGQIASASRRAQGWPARVGALDGQHAS